MATTTTMVKVSLTTVLSVLTLCELTLAGCYTANWWLSFDDPGPGGFRISKCDDVNTVISH